MNEIREWIVSRVTLIVDNNDADLYRRVTDAAVETLNTNGVRTKSDFREAAAGRGPQSREDLEDCIGVEVVDILRDMVDSIEDDTMRVIVSDVLDLGDRQQRQMLGAHYWPDDDDAFEDDEDDDVPDDFPVRVLGPDDSAADRVTCGECGRSWDDAVVTSMTPAPSARCPFEAFH